MRLMLLRGRLIMTVWFVKGHRIVRLGQAGEVRIWYLLILVAILALGVLLAATNPSTEMYLAFVEGQLGKALDGSESLERTRERNMVRTIFRAHSHELVVSLV